MKNIIITIALFFITANFNLLFPQSFSLYQGCGMEEVTTSPGSSGSLIGGYLKPHRTDIDTSGTTPPEAKFHILVVFVQFSNETQAAGHWPINDEPDYMDDLFATSKNPTGDYWGRYNENSAMLSDWFQEVSKGRMHVTGRAVNIILDHPDWWYNANGGINTMNEEIYEKLKHPSLGIIWTDYDLWAPPVGGVFRYKADKYVDMIFRIHRSRNDTLLGGYSGIAMLGGSEYMIDSTNQIKINGGFADIGSGLSIQPRGIATKEAVFGFARHEYGHYLFGSGHNSIGIMGAGDMFFTPWEQLKLGYFDPIIADYGTENEYNLADYSSYYSDGEILKVELSSSSDFLLIANRMKDSKYDVAMLGDTSRGSPFLNVGDYGKGLYIYHSMGGFNHPSAMDQECADGLFNWTQDGYGVADWEPPTNTPWLPVFVTTAVTRSNDDGSFANAYGTTAYGKDGRNVLGKRTDDIVEGKWFSIGKMHTTQGGEGFDRLFTIAQQNWTSREHFGDRWDAWDLGYNQVFSPYSSPATHTSSNGSSGVFIYYESIDHGVANIKVYRDGYNNLDEDEILELTPPSRPMGVQIENCDEGSIYNGWLRPKITWLHNLEPDMERGGGFVPEYKRYKIYRSIGAGMNSLVPDAYRYPENVYSHIATVDIGSNLTPTYIDTSLLSICNSQPDASCPPVCWVEIPVRYRIQAVDKHDDLSNLSEFAYTNAYINDPEGGNEEEDSPPGFNQSDIPTVFDLKQNFPNPFNPSTNIQFDIPKDVFVSIKVYDMLGREVAELVNEVKYGGRYIVGFNGSNLASGIYYYKIKAGNFEQTRRMVLIK